jgi:hypothetical protein
MIGNIKSWKDKTSIAKKAGDDYLAYQFGWKPIMDDLFGIANAMLHAEQIMRQYERDSGRMVRRRFSFAPERSISSSTVRSNVSPYIPVSGDALYTVSPATGKVICVTETSRNRWFSGAFTYYLPSDYSTRGAMARQLAMAKKTIGLSLTPDVVWNLAPWSWAVDWFTNAGDVLSNVTDWATDGLVMKYGYMMEHTRSVNTYYYSGFSGLKSAHAVPMPLSLVVETKQRRKANPFGFGLTWGGLSPRQLSILAALGITKTHR